MRGEEAYEIDALARQKLAALGFVYEDRMPGKYTAFYGNDGDKRIVLTMGWREGSIVHYGDCILQTWENGDWQTKRQVGIDDFAYGRTTFPDPEPPLPVPVFAPR